MSMRIARCLVPLVALAIAGCTPSSGGVPGPDDLPPVPDTPPAWAADAVWYEIDVDRFRNETRRSDPTVEAVARAEGLDVDSLRDLGWRRTPWTADPAARAAWERALGRAEASVPLRRYGGDLQGVLDRLPALDTLGVTALVLRVADAAAPWHVDPWLGERPDLDLDMIELEEPDNPATWSTTSADRLLLDLVDAAHDRGLRVVLDVAWPGSLAAAAPDSATSNALATAVRWLDPDGDGDPADGVDGFRLDTAPENAAFRRDLRRVVKAIQPEAVLVGRPSADGDAVELDALDAVVDTRAFAVLQALLDPAGPQISAADAASELADLYAVTPPDHLPAFWSAAGGPEAPRLSTALTGGEGTSSGIGVPGPTSSDVWTVGLYRLLQATLPGAPHVLYGDEVGLRGTGGLDNRRPMLWDDLDYAVARAGGSRAPVVPDAALRDLTRDALRLRRDHADLFARGTLVWEPTGDVFRFTRRTADEEAVVVVNLGALPARVETSGAVAFHVGPAPGADAAGATLAPRSGAVFLRTRTPLP